MRGFGDVYNAISDSGGDLAAVTETQWQQLDGKDGKDGKGQTRIEAKAARKLAKQLREGAPIETDWRLYDSLTGLPPKELATLPIWDHADKLNRAEFLLLAERQQQTRAALASGAPVTAAGAPGSLDAQLAALAARKGWTGEQHAETRGLYEREIRAEIAEAVEANGGQPLTIAERRELITEAAAEMPATAVAIPSGADDTLVGGAGDDQLRSFASHGAPDVPADDGVVSGGVDDTLASSVGDDTLGGGANSDTPEENSEESGFFSQALDAAGESLSGAYRIVAGGANDAVNGFLDVTDEMAQLIEGELPEGFAPYVVWDENGIRFEKSRPEGIEPIQFPKVQHGGGAVEEMARSVSRFVAGMALMGGVGKGVSAGRMVLSGSGSAAMFDPEGGNLATMAKALGIESEFLDWLDAKVGADAGPAERLLARVKMAGEELFLTGAGALLAKSLPLLKSSPEITQKAREALGGGKRDVVGIKAAAKPDPELVKSVFDVASAQAAKTPTSGKRIVIEPSMFGGKPDIRKLIVNFVRAQRDKLRKSIGREVALNLPDVPVSEMAVKAAAKSDIDIDISNYRHVLQSDGIGHAFKKHGAGNERDIGQIPITSEDFVHLPDVLSNPDNVVIRNRGRKGAWSIRYEKRTNGSITVIELVTGTRKASNELVFLDMWKKGESRP